jgi:hypothetical protein
MLPVETFGDSDNRESIVLVPEDLQEEFPPVFDEKYPGKPLWPDLLISPSQISTYTSCNRKWGWYKLEGKKEPEKPSQAKGKLYHKGLEDWLTEGTVPGEDLDRLLPALKHFPEPGTPGLAVERYFSLLFEDVVFHGYTDVDVQSSLMPLEVYDLKTTKDFCWAKTPSDLGADPQNSVYALKQMVEVGAKACDTRWVYCLTEGGRKALPVDRSWTFDEALTTVCGWLPFARAMRDAHRAKKKATELGFNASHCGAYGGCFYQTSCQISGKDRMKAMFMQSKLESNKKEDRRETMAQLSLKERMAADLAKKGVAVPASGGVVSVQKSATVPTTAAAAQSPKLSQNQPTATLGKKPSLAELSKALKEGKAPTTTPAVTIEETGVKLATGINPPDAAPDPRNLAEEVVVEEVPAAQEAAPPAAAEPTKKPRAKKAVTEAVAEAVGAGFGFTLLVDALLEKGPNIQRVDTFLGPLKEELAEKAQVPSYLLIDFNKGPAMLAAGLREFLKQSKPNGVFAVDSRTVDPAVLVVLSEFADNIVRGVR